MSILNDLRALFPTWSKRALEAHREHKTPCPKCGSQDIGRWANYPGRYWCFVCRHRWTDQNAIVSAYIRNPEAG